jgi:RNA polymerase sigma-70 factor, ECF subfamily
MAVEPEEIPEVRLVQQFEGFYRDQFSAVVAVAYALTRDHSTAEEIAQEAFLRALRGWKRVGSMDYPGAWVRRVVVNLALSRFRRLKTQTKALVLLHEEPPRTFDPDDVESFWQEVRSLPTRQAQAIALRYVEDMAVADIALVLEVAEGTVKALLHQGRERLRRQLKSRGLVEDEI